MDINKALDNIKNKNNFYLRNIEDENSKNKWITILNKNPNKAIEEYHKILCKNNPENEGFCNLLDLFKCSQEELNQKNSMMSKLMNAEKLEYNDREYTYNSRLAQELGYWAQTKYDNQKIHEELYKSYFINKSLTN